MRKMSEEKEGGKNHYYNEKERVREGEVKWEK